VFLELLPETAPVVSQFLKGFAIFETDITVHDHLHCF
jgi:hypothetical protein